MLSLKTQNTETCLAFFWERQWGFSIIVVKVQLRNFGWDGVCWFYLCWSHQGHLLRASQALPGLGLEQGSAVPWGHAEKGQDQALAAVSPTCSDSRVPSLLWSETLGGEEVWGRKHNLVSLTIFS